MIGRRGMLASMVYGAGGLGQPRRDQELRAGPDRVVAPGGAAGIVRARRLIAGPPAGAQIIIQPVNFTISIKVPPGLASPSNVASIAPITIAEEFTSGNPAEQSPPFIAETLITFTDTSVADALLILSGFYGLGQGAFTMHLSARSLAGGGNQGAVLTGTYTTSGTAITLTPAWCDLGSGGGLVGYGATQISRGDPASTTLLVFANAFGDLGSTGLAGDAGSASYKFGAEGDLILSIHKSFTALGAITTATFANLLPAAYIPPAARLTGGSPIAINGAALGNSTRLTITAATGAVNLVNLPAGATAAGCDVRIPLS